MNPGTAVISADSHVTEPADLWCQRLDRTFRDRAPRVVRDYQRDLYLFVAPGVSPFRVATGFGAGKRGSELKQHLHHGYEAARRGGWDPAARLQDQDIDGVCAEVLYPTHAMRLFALSDAELQRACFRVYNEWIAEFAAYDRCRLIALGLVSLRDVQEAVRELEVMARLGLRGVLIWSSPPEDQPPYESRLYDDFWRSVADLQLPVSLHAITSGRTRRQVGSESAYIQYMEVIREVQQSLIALVCGGVLERFPKLRIVSAENDCGWVPHYAYRLDHAYEMFGKFGTEPLGQPPSRYLAMQVSFTFGDEPVGVMGDALVRGYNLMWASDYPHVDSTWPHSRQVIEQLLAGLSDPVTDQLLASNVRQLYGLSQPK